MAKPKTLIKYVSEEGEHVRIVSGRISRRGIDGEYFENGEEDRGKLLRQNATEIYVGGNLQTRYTGVEHKTIVDNGELFLNELDRLAKERTPYADLVAEVNELIASC